MLSTLEPHIGMCWGENPFAWQHQGYMLSILMMVLDNFILSLEFLKITTCAGTEKATSLSTVWLTLQTSSSFRFFTLIQKKADMTSRLIGSDLSNQQSSPVRAKVECCKSHNLFSCHVTDCSATRISSSSIMGCHLWPTGRLIGGGLTPLQRCSWGILQPQLTGQPFFV